MKKICFYILFFCSGISTFAQQAEWREFIDKKQFEKVILQASNMQPADSTDVSKMFLIGQAYEGLLKYREAYNCYKQCYALDSTRTDMLNTLARISGYLGRTEEAEKYYKQVIGYDSTNFYANYQLARLYMQIGNPIEGMKYYDFLLDKDPENAILLRAKGDCYTKIDSLEEAKDCYYKAYYNNVENAPLASQLINTLLKLYHPIYNDYFTTAWEVCDTASFYHPENIALRQSRAMMFYMNNNYFKADSVYTSLMESGDSCFVTLKYCGTSRFNDHKWFASLEPLEKAYAVDSTAADVCILLGMATGRTYSTKLAFEYFDKAEKLMMPDEYWSDLVIKYRAEMFFKEGNYIKAAELYYRIWMKKKEDVAWIQNLLFYNYTAKSFQEIPDEKKHRLLFLSFLYISETLKMSEEAEESKRDELHRFFPYIKSILKKYQEEMFFRNMKEYPMIAPDGKKNALSAEKLKELIDKLPEK